MRIYIYDIEVYAYDWIVVLRQPTSTQYTVIHNDNFHLRAFLQQANIVLGGFNNKHYDDWIIRTMLKGGSNHDVKRHNDHIIGGGEGCTFPFIAYQKKTFKSFDLRDDISDKGISLKAIEGNLGLPIVESSVPFDIKRPLTKEEREEVIEYCKRDVDATVRLYEERKENYIDAKILISEMYGVPIEEGIGMTNAKLCARILGAKPQDFNDERDYTIPPNIDTSKIPKQVLDFFMLIRDKSISDTKLFGDGKGSKGMTLGVIFRTSVGDCPTTYAWGGVHGAKPCVTIEETSERVIINYDVSSLYPNSMLNFGYCSRAMEDPENYRRLVDRRMGYKHSGDALRSNALKLPINTTFGAMLNPYNALMDRKNGRSVCITNQLAMTMLITDLGHACETIDFVNINTDGIMFTIDRREVEKSEQIIEEWSAVTNFEMERSDFIKLIQKDVNNYIGIEAGGKVKTKGSYVSLYKGGNFKTNSLSIIHKAIVDYFINGTAVEQTLDECDDILKFQQIVKTGSTFEGAYQYVNGKRVPIQKVNRIYAVKDEKYGAVVKGKWITEKRRKNKETGKMESTPVDPPIWSETVISECPTHAYIDNENVLTKDALDMNYYIEMAKNRIDKYLTIDRKKQLELSKIKEVIEIMAEKKETKKQTEMNLYEKLNLARTKFLEAPVKKSGINRFAGFKYFELSDIVPVATSIFNDLGLLYAITFMSDYATGTLINTDKPEERISFSTPTVELIAPTKTGETKFPNGMNSVQAMGSVQTYFRRYLYMTCLDIVEADAFDATQKKPAEDETTENTAPVEIKPTRPATPEKREEVKKELIDENGSASETQIKSIKNGLKKLRAKDEKYEGFLADTVEKIAEGLNKADAENILLEISRKMAE